MQQVVMQLTISGYQIWSFDEVTVVSVAECSRDPWWYQQLILALLTLTILSSDTDESDQFGGCSK